jgi:hypothetical protein
MCKASECLVFDLKLNEIEVDFLQNECANVGTSVKKESKRTSGDRVVIWTDYLNLGECLAPGEAQATLSAQRSLPLGRVIKSTFIVMVITSQINTYVW